MAVHAFTCCVLLSTFAQVSGGAEPQVEPEADRKRLLDQFAADAAKYQITIRAAQPTSLDLLPQPVLNWHGSAFVWLKDGRPEVIGALWQTVNVRSGQTERGHAFHSLSDHPVTAELDSQLVWSPKAAGLQLRPVDGAEVPAGDSQRRLAQLRSLSREFSAIQWKGGRSQLRMLTQPIFRYEPASGPAKDGAIFAFTNTEFGTDPDALLVLEARRANDALRWEYSFARFHYTEMSGNHRDKEVWRVEDTWAQRKLHVFGADPGRDSASTIPCCASREQTPKSS
jgi:hypothetical protein